MTKASQITGATWRPSPRAIIIASACVGIISGILLQRSRVADGLEPDHGHSDEMLVDSMPIHSALDSRNSRYESLPSAVSGLPLYPGSRPESLGERASIMDLSLDMAWFTTPDSVEEVVYWYEDVLAEAGYPMVSSPLPGGSWYVGYEDPATDETHTVTIVEHYGETLVIPSIGRRTETMFQGKEALPPDLPHPESAEKTTVVKFSDMGSVQYNIAAWSDEGVQRVLDFYRSELPVHGWNLLQASMTSHNSAYISTRKGRTNTFITLIRDFSEGYPVTQIHIQMTQRS